MKAIVETELSGTKYTFEIEEKDTKETLLTAIALGNPPRRCDECGNKSFESFKLESSKTSEGHIYIKTICRKCGAKANLGTYQNGGGHFWHKFEKYIPKDNQSTQQESTNKNQPPTEQPPVEEVDDLPF